jgi:hypothetical protein
MAPPDAKGWYAFQGYTPIKMPWGNLRPCTFVETLPTLGTVGTKVTIPGNESGVYVFGSK